MVNQRFSMILVVLVLLAHSLGHATSQVGSDDTNAFLNVSGVDEQGKTMVASLAQLERRLGSTDGTIVNGVCVDYTVEGYFPSRGAALSGVPAGFVTRPPTISTCELESLHKECVQRVNMYRSGHLKFSDGSSDTNAVAGLSPLQEMTGINQCSSHQTLGDHVRAQPSGFGCAGAHFTAFSCASGAQNSCCSWFKETTYNGVKQRLFDCLQSMWDEGITPGQKGHWETMRSTAYGYASCGFAWDEDAQLSMNQDFFRGKVSDHCTCKDKQVGESDGCGGSCVACSEPVVEPCKDAERTNVFSSSCSGPLSSSGRPYCTCQDVQKFSWCNFGSVSTSCPLTCNTCPVLQPTCPSGPPHTSTTTITTTTITTATTTTTTVAATTTTTVAAPTTTTVAASTTTTSAALPTVGRGIQSGDVIFLQAYSGSGNIVDVEGDMVRTRWSDRGNWQAMILEKGSGGNVQSGDTVYLKTHTGAHIDVEGDSVRARWEEMGSWQALSVEKLGGGVIMPGDVVCFKAHTGKHIDVHEGILRARWEDCGAWQSFRVDNEPADAIKSGDAVHLLAHTGNMIDVEGSSVQARWHDQGEWQKFVIENHGGRAIFSGDAVYLQAHTGNHIDVSSGVVQARWHDYGAWQRLFIEKIGGGAIFPGDIVFLRSHTGKHIAVEGIEVTAHWQDHGAWQSLVIGKAADRRLQANASAPEEPAMTVGAVALGLLGAALSIALILAIAASLKLKQRKQEVSTSLLEENVHDAVIRKVHPTAEMN